MSAVRVTGAPFIRESATRGQWCGNVSPDSHETMPRNQTDISTLDRLFEALSHPYRRRILTELHDQNPHDEVEFSAAALAETADDPQLADVELFHRHLPKLAEAGFIDWGREEYVVRRGPRFDEVAPLIELMRNHPDELPAGWP